MPSLLLTTVCIFLLQHTQSSNLVPTCEPTPREYIFKEDLSFSEESHRLLSRKYAAEGMVLATNNCLPLKKTDKITLFGEGTVKTVYGGWGSGQVFEKGIRKPISPVTIKEGVENKAKENRFQYQENDKGYFLGSGLKVEDIKKFSQKEKGVQRAIAILTLTRRSGESVDRYQVLKGSSVKLEKEEIKTYNKLIKYFDHVVVILNVCSMIELGNMPSNNKTSILIAFLPGMEAGNAVADVLVGDVCPCGKLSDTWAKTIEDYPSTYPFMENKFYTQYKEGLYVGYRYFEEDEETQKKVAFPFGFGLSYTKFEIKSTASYDEGTNTITVLSEVKNVGNYTGKEVIQVYVQKQQNPNFVKVARELVAFNKTRELKPNETQILTNTFNVDYMSSYDDTGVTGHKSCYILEKGAYNIYAGTSVADTRGGKNLVFTYKNPSDKIVSELSTRLKPKDPVISDQNKKPDFSKFMYKKLDRMDIETIDVESTSDSEKEHEQKPNTKKCSPLDPTLINPINFKSVLQGKYTFEDLTNSMNSSQLVALTYGHERQIRSGTGTIGGFYHEFEMGKFLIPSADTLDGPAGLRQTEPILGSTAWPCSTLLANTFDQELIANVGFETAKEARYIGVSFWLAPGMNIHRNPLGGRNFEYYSEDPLLTGKMAAALARGAQKLRVAVTLKHFAFNNKEEYRNGGNVYKPNTASDSRMSERVAREIYLKGFEIAIKEGDAWAVMTSYNSVNGLKASANYDLITGILRNEWGFKGLVMTDWGSNSYISDEFKAGSNVKMPTIYKYEVDKFVRDINKGVISRRDLEKNAMVIFNTIKKTAAVDDLFLMNKCEDN